jgi:hypothetical protein
VKIPNYHANLLPKDGTRWLKKAMREALRKFLAGKVKHNEQ